MILVFGRSGQVASALAGDARVLALGRDQADLADPEACAAAIRAHRPQAVINAAAWTAVDQAEAGETAARVINAEAPAAMARACAALGVPFVQISTDYVFDGTGEEPFAPEAPVAPLNAYGRTKLAGEVAVRAAGGVQAILRTSWVFSATGTNFARTMLRLGATRERLNVVADQIGGPTPAEAIAAACLTIAEALRRNPARSGTYHISGFPDVSWADFARVIMRTAALPCQIIDIGTQDFPTPAPRPHNSRLDNTSLTDTFGIPRPDWRPALARVIATLRETRP